MIKTTAPSYYLRMTLHCVLSRCAAFALAVSTLAFMPSMSAAGEGAGKIEGYVTNAATGLPIARAKVTLQPVFMEALTDEEGFYSISEVAPGTVQVQISYLGFEKQTVSVAITTDATTKRDFVLAREQEKTRTPGEDIVVLEKYSVVADQVMSAQALAMNEQRHAASIKNIVAFEELGDHGQENIGDYLRFIPGVVVVNDGETAGRLALGGFPAEMSNVQLDGGDVASTGVGGARAAGSTDTADSSSRVLSLQDIPMGNIERIEVTKVPTPDMPASGLGGSLNLVTKSLLGTKSAYLTYQVYMAFNTKDGLNVDAGGKQPTSQTSSSGLQPSFNASYVVPASKRLVFGVGISRTWRQRPMNTPTEQALWNMKKQIVSTDDPPVVTQKDIAMAQARWDQIALISTTENYQATVDWKIARNDTLTLTAQYRETASERATSRLTARFYSSNRYNPIGDGSYTQSNLPPAGSTSEQGVIEMGGNAVLNYSEVTDMAHLTLRYKHRGPVWKFDGQAVYSSAERTKTNKDKGYFAGVQASVIGLKMTGTNINVGDSILPNSYTITTKAGDPVSIYDGDAYSVANVLDVDGKYKTDLYTARLDAERPIGRYLSFKTGASYNQLIKDDRYVSRAYVFTPNGKSGSANTVAKDFGLVDDSIDVKMNGSTVRWISPVKLYDIYRQYPDWFVENTDSTAQKIPRGSVRLEEAIAAAYIRFDLRLLQNRLHAAFGVRYERTDLDGWSYLEDRSNQYLKDPVTGAPLRDSNNNLIVNPALDTPTKINQAIYQERKSHAGQKYDGFYPSININYSITENLVLRTAYARTLGRPDVKYIAGGLIIPEPDADADDMKIKTITVGNPGLEPWTADSFHLSLDSYHWWEGFGSIGIYRKNVSNFFARKVQDPTEALLREYEIPDSVIEYFENSKYVISRYENVGDATLTGLELSYRQDLFFLPSWMRKTQVWVNYTRLKVGGPNSEDFVGFASDVFSCGLNYISGRFSMRLSCAYQGETKTKNSGGSEASVWLPPDAYDYDASYTIYNMSLEYSLSKAFNLYMTWDNIFAKDRYTYRRAPGVPSYSERYLHDTMPSYIVLGVKGRF